MTIHSAEVKTGRTFGVTLGDGDDFFGSLTSFCETERIRFGYIPTFLGALRHARVAGTCRHSNAEAPMFDEYIDVDYAETVGRTIAWDASSATILPHVHLSLGRRMQGADGVTSHLLGAEVQFLLEMIVVEVISPEWSRPINRDLHDLKLLHFG